MEFNKIRSILDSLGNEIENVFQSQQHQITTLQVELDIEKHKNKKLKQLLYNFLEDDLKNE